MERWREIYEFWFGVPGTPDHGSAREMWFGGGEALDREIAGRFAEDYERAAAGELGSWRARRESALAQVVLLDQFPRNMFRGTGRAFAADPLARDLADFIVSGPLHDELMTVEKLFAYLPFEHSEALVDQQRCCALFEAMEPHDAKQYWLDYAVEHRVIIERFGRFPHRNAALDRTSTPEEEAWLASTDRRFGVASDDEVGKSAG